MSDGGGAYIEAWLSRVRMRREVGARSLAEADRMRCEESSLETKARLLVLVVAIVVVLYQVFIAD